MECHTCHKKGHYANQCPTRTTQRMYASRPIVDDRPRSPQVKDSTSSPPESEEPVGMRAMSPIDEVLDNEELTKWLELEEWQEDVNDDNEVVDFHRLYIPDDTGSQEGPIDSISRSLSPVYFGGLTIPCEDRDEVTEHVYALNEATAPQDPPKLPKEDTRLITQMVNIGGSLAYSLFDLYYWCGVQRIRWGNQDAHISTQQTNCS